MRLRIALLILTSLLFACSTQTSTELKTGNWMGHIIIDPENDEHTAPFNMEFIKEGDEFKLIVRNDSEIIEIDEIEKFGDSVIIYIPFFKNRFEAKITNDSLVGTFIKPIYSMPFYAVFGESERFAKAQAKAKADLSGKWKVIEHPGRENETVMIGEFEQDGDY